MPKIGDFLWCAQCQAGFHATSGSAKYCSPQCYKAASMVRNKDWYAKLRAVDPPRLCKACGDDIELGSARKLYCSDKCRDSCNRRKKKKPPDLDLTKAPSCINCQGKFIPKCITQVCCTKYCREQVECRKDNAEWVDRKPRPPNSVDSQAVQYSFFRKGRINGLKNYKVCRG